MKGSPGRRWLKLLLLLVGGSFALLWIFLQPPVLKALILLQLEKALEMDLSLTTLRLSPAKRIQLLGLQRSARNGSLDLELSELDLQDDLLSFVGDQPEIVSMMLKNTELLIRP